MENDQDCHLVDEIKDNLILTDEENPIDVIDVATQTEAKHANRRYIHCNIPKKFGK